MAAQVLSGKVQTADTAQLTCSDDTQRLDVAPPLLAGISSGSSPPLGFPAHLLRSRSNCRAETLKRRMVSRFARLTGANPRDAFSESSWMA